MYRDGEATRAGRLERLRRPHAERRVANASVVGVARADGLVYLPNLRHDVDFP